MKPLSREKILAHLKESIVPVKDVDNDFLYVYIAGKNITAEILATKILCGEMDE